MAILSRNQARQKKHLRERQSIIGTATKPRLCVFKSHQNFYAQLIDDAKGVTLASVSTLTLEKGIYHGNIEAAAQAGKEMATKIEALKLSEIVFDRGGYIYHGRVKAFAEAVRENAKGVKF
ncbi:50S ribosomal protein L18 [Mycoplasmopsis californica HAZ160_1]|uniref:Large ribosomal subunit protein uL18 n=2 Tax=Mycoplasmopsis californica TaxID=2113 RepID=A0A059XS10_9BACT|nr:50S ribosomal protein L18 [Mycoplasmopsis californica]AIA29603.1 50S ribosomal protein L18 [Mycoplasmopsis californica]BAP00958.1 50S ribosomal protein L18 [Mycoplasmopsis californica HAZ160_1]BBG40822.1 50S ribosomal protein L18 [Mycoplasmopsis californica]BBG41416.1 50S ribosomal protein L18 [Mycoplasmopsis californica]BBG42009.1 50S ribosomal protein L18 [Mycoplasmopsis californica]